MVKSIRLSMDQSINQLCGEFSIFINGTSSVYVCIRKSTENKKHLKNVGPIRHCEPPHALILHCHSPGVATAARRLRIDVHDNDDNNNDNA